MIKLSEIAYLSHIEHVEAVRTLPIPRRIMYALLSLGSVLLAITFAVVVSTALALFLVHAFTGHVTTMGDRFLVVASVVSAYMILIGISGNPVPRTIAPGDSLNKLMRRVLRNGLLIGAIGGFIFGVIWLATVRISSLYVQLNTSYDVRVDVGEILVYGLAIMIAVAVPFALFRAFYALSGYLTLHVVRQNSPKPNPAAVTSAR